MKSVTAIIAATLIDYLLPVLSFAEEPPKKIDHPMAGNLVLIPAGEFIMGAPESDHEASLVEQPAHKVKFAAPFYMGAHEVTISQFRRFVVATGYRTEAERDGVGGWGYDTKTRRFARNGLRFTWRETGFEQSGSHPVVNVTWDDCVAYCDWLTLKDEKRVFRLPTEAEWEYACRGGRTSNYGHGDGINSLIGKENVADKSIALVLAREPAELAVINQSVNWNDRFAFSAEVGSFKPNRFGLYDMHGNVAEWVEDWYDEDKYEKGDAKPPTKGTDKIYRGGSWAIGASGARSAARHPFGIRDRWCHIGFRVVAEVTK